MPPHAGDTPCLRVAPAHQWLHATTGRITTDPHSWMQAVHWVHGSGHYTPSSSHGPRRMNETTLAVAQEISALKECRPGIAYLARKLKVEDRTVKYHLGMLREAGLLVYRSKGTRVRGEGNQASVYERIIPTVFDDALGIRTTGEGVQRRPIGASMEHRKTLGKLAKKAARKVRRPRRRTPVSGRSRCTPMEGGTSGTSSAASTYSPPESKLASGTSKSPTPKKSNRGPRKLNKIGRRYQLARELIAQVPWLRGASIPRIAWIIRHVADEGWTALEVQAAAERIVSDKEPRRPSGLLAYRLASCHLLYTTEDRRKVLVEDWQDSRAAEQARHAEAAYNDLGEGPKSPAARRAMDEAYAVICGQLNRRSPAQPDDNEHGHDVHAGDETSLEQLDSELVKACRAEASADPTVITGAINAGLPEQEARRLYSHRLVDQALALETINARHNTLAPAF
ncbi:winged helix-turn-helix domain-containing protein [Streptomyces sp. NPDC056112]|uniref:helix-turn-helix domain-containing protein n=1 Tax=Streptomyces sp. NPDC056112 TaxID=3345715 RepID=UPI0035E25DEF